MKSPINRLRLFAYVLMSTVCANIFAQDRTPSPERFFEYMDRNRDGNLDQEEVRRMPSSFRSSLENSGIKLDGGVSREVFIREIPKAFEQMRAERERDEERRRDESRGREEDSRRSEDRSRREPTPDRTPAPKPVSVYTPRKKVEITVDLPSRFEDGDTDGDGQIGLYEWRKWRPEERAHFKVYDKNGDGFLTPRELIKPPTSAELIAAASGTAASVSPGTSPAPAAVPAATSERGDRSFSRGGDRNRRGSSYRRDESSREERVVPTSTGSPVAVAVAPVEDATTRTAKLLFARMDADKNSQITSEEWARSRTVKPKFEEAGIDVSNALNEQQFIEAYKKAYGK